jgi:hypothetical protein
MSYQLSMIYFVTVMWWNDAINGKLEGKWLSCANSSMKKLGVSTLIHKYAASTPEQIEKALTSAYILVDIGKVVFFFAVFQTA